MKTPSIKRKEKVAVVLGCVFILIGLIFNKYTLERTVIADGEISSTGRILLVAAVQLLFIGVGIFLILKRPHIDIRIRKDFTVVIGLAGIITGVLLTPPLFSRIFAVSALLGCEIKGLWFFSIALIAVSLLFILYRGKGKNEMALFLFAALFIISIELTARLFVVCFLPGAKQNLAKLANRTYIEYSIYKGHPFVQYAHNPAYHTISDTISKVWESFNKFGLIGPEYEYAKPENVVRIACLGGSTTAKGYPRQMEIYLNGLQDDDSYRFEVMNFGIGRYTTAHLLVNFVLNVVNYDLDYIVIHSAWNESIVRNTRFGFRSDYSHALKYYHEPLIYDRFPIRISIIYRYMKDILTSEPSWAFIHSAIIVRNPDELLADAEEFGWNNLDELKPYRRNIETIIELALLRSIKVVLVTQPHSVNPRAPYYYIAPHVDQCNAVMREIGAEYADRILFVDLDETMTDKMDELFFDLCHMYKEGIKFKAQQIGEVIFDDWER